MRAFEEIRRKRPAGLSLRGRLFAGFATVAAVLAISVGCARYANNLLSEIVERAIDLHAPAATSRQMAADPGANQQQQLNREVHAAMENIRRANQLQLLLLAVGLVGVALIAGVSARSIATPLQRLTASMTTLANGGISSMVPETSRDDEIGALSRAFQALQAKLLGNDEVIAKLDATLRRLQAQSSIIDRLAIISEADDRGRITHVNENFCRISGYRPDELLGKNHAVLNSGLHPKSFWKDMYATLAKGAVWQGQVRNQAKDGSHYWVHSANTAIRDADGKLTNYLSLRLDITNGKKQEAELATQHLKLDAALENMAQGLVMFDAGQRLVVCNDRFMEMYALPRDLALPGTPLNAILDYHLANDTYQDAMPGEYEPERVAGLGSVANSIHKLADGRTIAVVRSPLTDGGWVTTHEDITHRLRLEDQIAHLALHDGLTDLANRTLLRERLERALASGEPPEGVAVLTLDLDRFKKVNDTLGHAIGDALLKAVAERLRNCVRRADTVARIGGDEFVVLQISEDPVKNASLLSQRLLEEMHAPFDVDGHRLNIGASIGIAVASRDVRDPGQAAGELGHRPLQLEEQRARHLSLLRAGHERAIRGTPQPGAGPAAGPRRERVRDSLSAHSQFGARQNHRV
jgi:diguanylate cyclase (GGDEF)-like protein/PAS domain S-box-containing protein